MAKNKSVTIRRSLLTRLLLIIVALSSAIFVATTWGIRHTLETLSRSLIEQTTDQTESELNRFFNPVNRQLQMAAQWGRQGMLDITDPAALNKLFLPLMKTHSQISSVLLADGTGREYLLLHTGDRWLNRETRTAEWGGKSRLTRWGPEMKHPEVTWENLNYDPHSRPWYQGAVRNQNLRAMTPGGDRVDPIHWTKPYIFFTTKDPGITASMAFKGPDAITRVIAFDVLLRDITQFTMGLKMSEHGQAVVLSDDDFRVIGLPRALRFADEAQRKALLLKTPEELGVPIMMDTMQAYRRGADMSSKAYRVKSAGKTWWVGVRSYPLSPQRLLYITVVVPETDLQGGLQRMRLWILIITGTALLLAVLDVIYLANRYSTPIEALVVQSKRISRGNLEARAPITSRFEEFQRLAKALDRMREGLRSLLKMERDMQLARQIQQDTFPQVLPQLDGYQIAAWNMPAEQAGGDTYDVIGLSRPTADGSAQLALKKADIAVFLLADATGHGIGPALLVAQVRAMIRLAARMGGDPASIIRHMNAQLCSDLKEGRFITAWFGWLNAAGHRLYSFSAGQGPLLYLNAREQTCRVYGANMPPLGAFEDVTITLPEPIATTPGDIFAAFSDGLFEAVDPAGNMFGKERIMEVLKAHRTAAAEDILAALRGEIDAFTGSAPPDDDRTAIIIKRQA